MKDERGVSPSTINYQPSTGSHGRADVIEKGVPLLVAVVGAALIGWWVYGYVRFPGYAERPLGLDRIPRRAPASIPLPAMPAMLPAQPGAAPAPAASAPGAPAASGSPAVVASVPGAWPRFRGPNGDNISPETTPLAREWGAQGPRLLWQAQMGEGYAAAAVYDSRVYVLDYDQAAQADTLRCFAFADGRELWRQSYRVEVKRNHGMSRTIPAVSGKYVVTIGPKCHVLCADRLTGRAYWMKDLVAEFGATVPQWYCGQCPLIDGNRLILATGGSALLVAVDLATGKVLWRSPNPNNWEMTHSSVVPMTLNGRKMYVYCGSGGVAGVSAKDGAILWETQEWTINTATIPSPLPVGEGRIFLSGGYDSGSMMLQLKEEGGRIVPRILFRLPSNIFGSDQQTPIFYKGYIYGVIPDKELVCLDLNGKQVWASGNLHRFGMGPYVLADGMIYVLSDNGTLTLVEAAPTGYKQLAEARVLEGPEAWGPLAIAGGRLLARDLIRMVCLDIARH
jgi:outer membrane protein assembly factor BamB